jgi:hypothetical protein
MYTRGLSICFSLEALYILTLFYFKKNLTEDCYEMVFETKEFGTLGMPWRHWLYHSCPMFQRWNFQVDNSWVYTLISSSPKRPNYSFLGSQDRIAAFSTSTSVDSMVTIDFLTPSRHSPNFRMWKALRLAIQ